jgi:mannose-6-phosphate isomerase
VLGDRLAQEPPPRFPLLVKLLEVEGALSVQVHPDAENARRLGDGARGKHEAWLVLDASTRAEVALGLVSPHTPEALRALTESGELGSRLNLFHARPGDAFDIPPGTLHAARGGLVILEVQETTDVTYRLFDWQNTGPDGRRRELHVEKALACARLDTRARPPLRVPPGTSDLALPGAPFGVEIVDLRADARSLPRPLASEGGPEVWVALEGRTTLSADAHEVTLSPGQAAVVLGCTGTLQARAREGTARAARTVARVPRTREEALA